MFHYFKGGGAYGFFPGFTPASGSGSGNTAGLRCPFAYTDRTPKITLSFEHSGSLQSVPFTFATVCHSGDSVVRYTTS